MNPASRVARMGHTFSACAASSVRTLLAAGGLLRLSSQRLPNWDVWLGGSGISSSLQVRCHALPTHETWQKEKRGPPPDPLES
jgi:hypothetical protein